MSANGVTGAVIVWRRIGTPDETGWESAALEGDGPFFIGRARDCIICLHDIQISRKHLRIDVRPPRVIVTDIGSSNGAHIEGRAVTATVWTPGERLVVGAFELRLAWRDGAADDAFDPVETVAQRPTEVRFRPDRHETARSAHGLDTSRTDETERQASGEAARLDPRAMKAAQDWASKVATRRRAIEIAGKDLAGAVNGAGPVAAPEIGQADPSATTSGHSRPHQVKAPAGTHGPAWAVSRPQQVRPQPQPPPQAQPQPQPQAQRSQVTAMNPADKQQMHSPGTPPRYPNVGQPETQASRSVRVMPSGLVAPLAAVVQVLLLAAIVITSVVMTVKVILVSVSSKTSVVENKAREVLSGFGIDLSGILGNNSKTAKSFAEAVDPWSFAWDIEAYRALMIGSFAVYILLSLAFIAWHGAADRAIVRRDLHGVNDDSMLSRLLMSPASWLLPVVNLIQPPRAVAALVDALGGSSGDRLAIWCWWGMLLSGGALVLSSSLSPSESLDAWGVAQFIIGPLLVIGSAAAAVIVVREVTRRLVAGAADRARQV